jgi:hypothetical protein
MRGRRGLLLCVVECHSVVHHGIAGLGGGNVVGLLVGSGVGYKTPAAGRSRESLPVGAHWEAEGGRVVEGQGWGTGWRWTSADGAWEDGSCSCNASCRPLCWCMLLHVGGSHLGEYKLRWCGKQ